MIITSTGIKDGIIDNRYGKHGSAFDMNGVPSYSLPFKVEQAPKGTKCFALLLEDKDAFPVSNGFSWIHWTAANITRNELKDNESRTATDFIQGVNSWISVQGGSLKREHCRYYGGMTPPDKPHIYELHVFALNSMLDLQNGFNMNEMFHLMRPHILETSTLLGIYPN